MPVLTEEKKHGSGGGVIPPYWPNGHGGGGDSDDESGGGFPVSKGQVGLWVLLTGITMLFAGLTSAYIVLRGAPSWQNVALPATVWWNTLILVLSSATLEMARSAVKQDRLKSLRMWVTVAAVLGFAFLVGQLVAWRQLVNVGVYLPSTLHSSFFYILTGLHGLHLVGGIVGLCIVLRKALRNELTSRRYEALKLGATYWHFMLAVWIYLFLLLILA